MTINEPNINEIAIELEQAFYAGDVKECRKATRKALDAGIDPLYLLKKDLEFLKCGLMICYFFKKIEKKSKMSDDGKEQICNSDVKLVLSLFNDISNIITSTMNARKTTNTKQQFFRQKNS